ncbi:PREDICTED: receptor protein kinase-like protein At4g34220 [Camelina sativa]|uniref:Receptor protein kinase-like protein At4g34220 n=1 Tax=Camelina sativa TaxID=90675 RepID=A0ABM0UVW2_CAMSA|nr:PREDICTED: receptor protein kinase-like protein At4g34220 [Camelina sativa]
MTSNRSNLLFSLVLFHLLLVPTQLQSLNTDGVLLLAFKYSILSDPLSVLRNWNYEDASPCLWTGVTCMELGKPNTPDTLRVTSLALPNKNLSGSVTPDLFFLPHLRILDLSTNFFNGSLPDSLFNATELQNISLGSNNLSGDLPKSINTVINLQLLNLSANAFTGKVPPTLSLLKNLTVISLTKNSFSGDIPSGFEAAQVLDLSSNLLNGSLPKDLGGKSVHYLNVSYNKVLGEIPPSFAEKFPANATVDLSFNNLTGPIPTSPSLLNQKAESFSGNQELCGEPLKTLCSIPSTLSNPPNNSETTSPAIAVKPRSSPPKDPLTESPNQTAKSKLKPSTIAAITVGDIAGLAIIGLLVLYVYQVRKRRRYPESSRFSFFKFCLEKNESKKSNHHQTQSTAEVTVTDSPDAKAACGSCIILTGGRYEETSTSESDVENQHTVEAFSRTDGGRLKQSPQTQLVTVDGETRLDLDTLLKASAYILGTTGTGIVYKAVLENGTAFAVRRIETECCAAAKLKEFEREIRAIAKLRHPNLVRIRGFCWGDDEKLLISDYVSNTSLLCFFSASKASSSSSSSSLQNPLSFEARLKIARGMARGLCYINEKKHVHGNMKPNNILLNAENEPIITDLGLDRLMTPARESQITGPTPYQPPEWSTSQKPNPKWDVYSFGVILLELLTGKVFSVDQDIDQFSNLSGSETEEKGRFMRLIDGPIRSDVSRHEDAAIVCFRLGIECVSSLPQKRPSMKEVVQVLEKVSL